MELKFYLVKTNGEKVNDMTMFEDVIFEILACFTDEHDEVTLGDGWFSMSKVPSLREVLSIERKLVTVGLVIDA